jgi:acyl-CoA synthetase (AMP-forming)/AMP-acid ligase II
MSLWGKSIDQIISIIAALYSGAIFVPILPGIKGGGMLHIIKNSGMTALIADQKRLKEAESFHKDVKILIGSGDLTLAYPNLPYLSQHFFGVNVSLPDRLGVDLAAIIYSSGSTGRPKGIMVTHRNLADGARIVARYLGTDKSDRIASILSFNFDYGLNQLWQSLYTGASIHLHELIMPNDCIRFISQEKITALPLMPVIMSRLFDQHFLDKKNMPDLSSVRYICSSGGRVSQEMLGNVNEIFPKAIFYSMYGLTEAFRSTYLPPEQLYLRPNSIGKAIPDVEILVLDDAGNECSPGVTGELVHRGGCITRGYWNDPERTIEKFRSHPRYPGEILVYSGDLVIKDNEGFITFVMRKDDMLKCNGIRISPTEIEEVLECHPKVRSAVVFGIENVEIGHDIVAAYTSKDGVSIDKAELILFLRKNIANHMIPRHFIHHDNFQATGNQGKIDRVNVKEKTLSILRLDN